MVIVYNPDRYRREAAGGRDNALLRSLPWILWNDNKPVSLD